MHLPLSYVTALRRIWPSLVLLAVGVNQMSLHVGPDAVSSRCRLHGRTYNASPHCNITEYGKPYMQLSLVVGVAVAELHTPQCCPHETETAPWAQL